jgi:hypothetical protein
MLAAFTSDGCARLSKLYSRSVRSGDSPLHKVHVSQAKRLLLRLPAPSLADRVVVQAPSIVVSLPWRLELLTTQWPTSPQCSLF